MINNLVDKHYEQGEIEPLKEALRTNLLVDISIAPDKWQTMGKEGVKQEVL